MQAVRRHPLVLVFWSIFIRISDATWTLGDTTLLWTDTQFAVGAYNDSVFIVGGAANKYQVTEYLISPNQFIDIGLWLPSDIYGKSQFWTYKDDILYMMVPYPSTSISILNMKSKQFSTNWMDVTFPESNSYSCLAMSDDYLFSVAGSAGPNNLLFALEMTTYAWYPSPPSLITPRTYVSCAYHQGLLCTFGGYNKGAIVESECLDTSDLAQNTWATIPPLTEAAYRGRTTAFEGYFYHIGGYGAGNPKYKDTVHVYDIQTNTMTVHSDHLLNPIEAQGMLMIDNTIYMFGGNGADAHNTWTYYTLPTSSPTSYPTSSPIASPTSFPTKAPTTAPGTKYPTLNPVEQPSFNPTYPSETPTRYPSRNPTKYPLKAPTNDPSEPPSTSPTGNPTTATPTLTFHPTANPINTPTRKPTQNPTHNPSANDFNPTDNPSHGTSLIPTLSPSIPISADPTTPASGSSTGDPTHSPTDDPSKGPSVVPTQFPIKYPTATPTSPRGHAVVTNAVTKDSEFNDIIHKEVHPNLETFITNPMYMGVVILALALCCFCVISTVICFNKRRKAQKAIEMANLFGTDAMGVQSASDTDAMTNAPVDTLTAVTPRDTSTPGDTLGGAAVDMQMSAGMITTGGSPYVQNGAFMPLDTRAAAMSLSVGAMSMPTGMGNAPFLSVPMASMLGHVNTDTIDNLGELADLPLEKRDMFMNVQDEEEGGGVDDVFNGDVLESVEQEE
eukprot:565327_1